MASETKLPTSEGWWLRDRGDGRTPEWFYVDCFDDGNPPSIYVNEIEDFIPVEKFTAPLTRWWGPIEDPFKDNA